MRYASSGMLALIQLRAFLTILFDQEVEEGGQPVHCLAGLVARQRASVLRAEERDRLVDQCLALGLRREGEGSSA